MTEDEAQEFWHCLWSAYCAYGLGDKDYMIEALDKAAAIEGTDWSSLRRKAGRPVGSRSFEPDRDANALALMDRIAQTKGIAEAETLARMVLLVPRFRTATKSEIGTGDVKRLARKWKAARKAKT